MLHTTMFLGYACNRLGTYFNLLVWIGALGSCGIYKGGLYKRMIYMIVPVCPLNRKLKSKVDLHWKFFFFEYLRLFR